MTNVVLDKRITFQRLVETVSDTGSVVKGWVNAFPPIWAKEMPISGREYLNSDQINTQIDTRFRIRYRKGLNAKMQILFEGQAFNIRHITPVERKQWLDIMAQAVEVEFS